MTPTDILAIISAASTLIKLANDQIQTWSKNKELTHDEDVMVMAKWRELLGKPWHRIDPDPTENGR